MIKKMEEKNLSNPGTSLLKYFGIPLIIVGFIVLGLFIFLKTFNPIALIMALLGLIPPILLRRLKEVSYNDENLIIKGLTKKELIGLHKIKRIYRNNTMINYTIEFTNNNNQVQTVDFWPSTNFIQLLNGQIPDNLANFIKRIE